MARIQCEEVAELLLPAETAKGKLAKEVGSTVGWVDAGKGQQLVSLRCRMLKLGEENYRGRCVIEELVARGYSVSPGDCLKPLLG